MRTRIKKILRSVYSLSTLFGIDPFKAGRTLKGLPAFLRDWQTLKRQEATANTKFPSGRFFPCLEERFSENGTAKGHYFHQDLLVARRVFLNNPDKHIDIGSRVDGFIAHVAAFRSIEVVDIRPLSNTVTNICFLQADLMSTIDAKFHDYCDSLSCLHALEHFGLGRYGDPVHYDGYLLGLDNLWKMLKKGGKLYFSVPIGPQRIEFNAHRVFAVSFLLERFAGKYSLDQFSFVDDKGNLHENIAITDSAAANNFNCEYGCGIFEMTKV